MKEVLPIKKSIFWSDLGIARKFYQKKAHVQLNKVSSSGATRTTLVKRTKDPMMLLGSKKLVLLPLLQTKMRRLKSTCMYVICMFGLTISGTPHF
jgi:hypothetical protein